MIPENDEKISKLLFLGDSLLLYRPSDEIYLEDTYPYISMNELKKHGKFEIEIRGERRNDTSTVALDEKLIYNIVSSRPDIVVVHLGIVDCAPRLFTRVEYNLISHLPSMLRRLIIAFFRRNRRFFTKHFPTVYVKKEDFKRNMEKILTTIKNQNAQSIIVNIAKPPDEKLRKSFNFMKNVIEYNKILDTLAEEYNCPIIDFYNATLKHPEYLLRDGIHPSKEGHLYLAKEVEKQLKKRGYGKRKKDIEATLSFWHKTRLNGDFMKEIKIGNRLVGDGEPCFIIAEAGVNHNGDIFIAKKLIDIAVESGADAVKFQTFKADKMLTKTAEKAAYQKETSGDKETQYEMIKRLELSVFDFGELKKYSEDRGIIFLSSPFDSESVDMLEELDIPAFKVGSGEITNTPLLRYIAQKRKPIILSTGMSYMDEVKEAVTAIYEEGNDEIILLHAVSNYPARIEDANLRVMETMRKGFDMLVGYSDHTPGIIVSIAAVAMGASVIEKHFTLDRNMEGPDHRASLEPEELKEMVKSIRLVEKSLGTGEKKPVQSEREMRKTARKSIVAKIDIPEGTLITRDMLEIKRPWTGLAPKEIENIVGKKAKKFIHKDDQIFYENLVNS